MFLRVFLRTRKLCLCFGQSEARQLLFPRGLQVRGMSLQNVHLNYKEAIQMLDSMVSNFAARSRAVQYPKNKMDAHRELFRKAGLSLDQLDSLSIIHLAGTKGKGSTSAMCESILRQSGLRTGLYTSPHLIDVRERIQINRRLLSEEKFAKYFWECYHNLISGNDTDSDASLPVYFGFLTVMACYVFLKEEIDVVIMEVGLGGEYDYTNVIRSPCVCGITSLGMDHIEILGSTLKEIAWQKAGIFKPGRPAFTVPQKQEATEVLFQRAKEIGVKSLKEVPPLSDYGVENLSVGLPGEHQLVNASLAVQLCKTWMEEKGKWPTTLQKDQLGENLHLAETFQLHPSFIEGLEKVKWSGRGQTIRQDNVTFYFDAAHNIDSIQANAKWFKSASLTETQSMATSVQNYKLLLFNVTGNRDSQSFLDVLSDCNYDFVLFCPSGMTQYQENSTDSSKALSMKGNMMESVYKNSQAWIELRERCRESGRTLTDKVKCFECISDAVVWTQDQMKQLEKEHSSTHSWSKQKSQPVNDQNSSVQTTNSVHFQVHVTGAHLVGGVLAQLGFTADDL